MTRDELIKRLAQLEPSNLIDYLVALFDEYPDISSHIEIMALRNDPEAQAKILYQHIHQIEREKKPIRGAESFGFANQLKFLLHEINTYLRPKSPKIALELLTQFLNTDKYLFTRLDDSSGNVSHVFNDICLAWLNTAAALHNPDIDLISELQSLASDNDYGVRDNLLPNAHLLLDDNQLRQLAWRYKQIFRVAVKRQKHSFDPEASSAATSIGALAKSLHDPELYAQSVQMGSTSLSDVQRESIAQQFVACNQPEKALSWISNSWEERTEGKRLNLLADIYEQLGDKEKLIETRQQLYKRTHSMSALQRYLSLIPESQWTPIIEEIKTQSWVGQNPIVSADLLLDIGKQDEAQTLVIEKRTEINSAYSGGLANLAKKMLDKSLWLGATVCYRALLNDILSSGSKRSYKYGHIYYQRLREIDQNIEDYTPIDNHDQYEQWLQNRHGRKYNFWSNTDSTR